MSRLEEELDEVRANLSKKVLELTDTVSNLKIYLDNNSKWPLTITIESKYPTDTGEIYTQSYSLNDHELIALYNLFHGIITTGYTKTLDSLELASDYGNLND